MSEREQTTLVNQVFHKIFDLLLSGQLPTNGVVNEVALAERFNVSRGPVREAISQLQGRGLIVKKPYMRARIVELSVANMIDIFQLRESVEGMSARLAAERMSDAAIDELLDVYHEAHATQSKPPLDMHTRIAEGSGNERIRSLLCDELYYLLQLYRTRSGEIPGRRNTASTEHWQILRAIKARDGQLAESLMRAHIAQATHALQDLLGQDAPLQPAHQYGH
ncbi:MAG TPA: GntR family transcriptional regulator [Pelagibacterium sp.]|uniref:GntR family transcriptional regulator n=1 Tax=Pelagibacterium sp. TaxID=1967288 RepID=UPI002CD35597|nr:GntR family transcriptional regulator [Pelagibacterium sp.]HWJ87725.1 GntR family transcriptional regulator [Pelagibacterium sp.]